MQFMYLLIYVYIIYRVWLRPRLLKGQRAVMQLSGDNGWALLPAGVSPISITIISSSIIVVITMNRMTTGSSEHRATLSK